MISLAIELAERQLSEGTASSQVLTHYLKLATGRERLEREKIERENRLLKAKEEAFGSTKAIEELYKNALSAMQTYSGREVQMPDEDE